MRANRRILIDPGPGRPYLTAMAILPLVHIPDPVLRACLETC